MHDIPTRCVLLPPLPTRKRLYIPAYGMHGLPLDPPQLGLSLPACMAPTRCTLPYPTPPEAEGVVEGQCQDVRLGVDVEVQLVHHGLDEQPAPTHQHHQHGMPGRHHHVTHFIRENRTSVLAA